MIRLPTIFSNFLRTLAKTYIVFFILESHRPTLSYENKIYFRYVWKNPGRFRFHDKASHNDWRHLSFPRVLSHNHLFKWWFRLALIKVGYSLPKRAGIASVVTSPLIKRYFLNLLSSILLPALLYISLLHLLCYYQLWLHNILWPRTLYPICSAVPEGAVFGIFKKSEDIRHL